jgi:Ca2+-dependent lipid-binding protein
MLLHDIYLYKGTRFSHQPNPVYQMGNKKSLPISEESRPDGNCVVEIISAQGLPNMDAMSLTDAYVTCQFTSDGKVLRNATRNTLPRNNSLNPVFHSYLAFPFIPHQRDLLFLNVFDKDVTRYHF